MFSSRYSLLDTVMKNDKMLYLHVIHRLKELLVELSKKDKKKIKKFIKFFKVTWGKVIGLLLFLGGISAIVGFLYKQHVTSENAKNYCQNAVEFFNSNDFKDAILSLDSAVLELDKNFFKNSKSKIKLDDDKIFFPENTKLQILSNALAIGDTTGLRLNFKELLLKTEENIRDFEKRYNKKNLQEELYNSTLANLYFSKGQFLLNLARTDQKNLYNMHDSVMFYYSKAYEINPNELGYLFALVKSFDFYYISPEEALEIYTFVEGCIENPFYKDILRNDFEYTSSFATFYNKVFHHTGFANAANKSMDFYNKALQCQGVHNKRKYEVICGQGELLSTCFFITEEKKYYNEAKRKFEQCIDYYSGSENFEYEKMNVVGTLANLERINNNYEDAIKKLTYISGYFTEAQYPDVYYTMQHTKAITYFHYANYTDSTILLDSVKNICKNTLEAISNKGASIKYKGLFLSLLKDIENENFHSMQMPQQVKAQIGLLNVL